MPNLSDQQHSQRLSLNGLTDDELGDIHQATLDVLENTGLFIETDEALEVFDGAGAEIDHHNKIVKIPPRLVEDAIQSAPSKILLAGRDPKHDIELGTGRVHFMRQHVLAEACVSQNGRPLPASRELPRCGGGLSR